MYRRSKSSEVHHGRSELFGGQNFQRRIAFHEALRSRLVFFRWSFGSKPSYATTSSCTSSTRISSANSYIPLLIVIAIIRGTRMTRTYIIGHSCQLTNRTPGRCLESELQLFPVTCSKLLSVHKHCSSEGGTRSALRMSQLTVKAGHTGRHIRSHPSCQA